MLQSSTVLIQAKIFILFLGPYIFFEATGLQPNDTAYLISPTIPEQMSDRCLTFLFNAAGLSNARGSFEILDEQGGVIWRMLDEHQSRSGVA